jgi:hypothetical protein
MLFIWLIKQLNNLARKVIALMFLVPITLMKKLFEVNLCLL